MLNSVVTNLRVQLHDNHSSVERKTTISKVVLIDIGYDLVNKTPYIEGFATYLHHYNITLEFFYLFKTKEKVVKCK